jgi:hypothetical protein
MMRMTRRRALILLGGSAAGAGLLAASGTAFAQTSSPDRHARLNQAVAAVLAPRVRAAEHAAAPLATLQQTAQASFSPINSTLTFGPPADVSSGWDGSLWAIDSSGAPHVYDSLSDSWQLHGSGIDAAALIQDQGPAVYFRAGEVFIADGRTAPEAIATLWPQLPPSYRKFGVKGAAWAGSNLVLFRGGTYLTVPWPGSVAADGIYHAALQPASTPSPTDTPSVAATPTPASTLSGSETPTPTRTAAAIASATSLTATAAQTSTPGATTTPAAEPSATPTASPSITPTSIVSPTPTATPTRDLATADYVASPLTGISGWPQSATWQHGVIDGVYSLGNNVVLLIKDGEFVTVSFLPDRAPLASGPAPLPLHPAFWSLPHDWQLNGFDAGFFVANGPYRGNAYAHKGARLVVYKTQVGGAEHPADTTSPTNPPYGALVDLLKGSSGPVLQYVPAAATGWPATWNPVLQHPPSGRTSGLWAATVDGRIVSHDGATWTQQPGDALSVAAGKDGSVFAVSQNNPQQLSQWNGSSFNTVAQHASPLSQVSVGAQNQVWTRDSSNAVHQLSQGQLQPVTLVGSAAHIAANHDGTLWSCSGADPRVLRLASDLNQAPALVPAAATVQKVASTGFGRAHCLTFQNETAQLYRYDSPYVFRTPGGYTFDTGDPIEQGLGSLFFTVRNGVLLPSAPPPTYQVVAVDAHTGQELSRSAPAPIGLHYTSPVFDPIHETLIVGLTTDSGLSPRPGQLIGLDARDLTNVHWTIDLPNNLSVGPSRPTLHGTQLCISNGVNSLLMYDTGATPNASPPSYRWTYTIPPPAPQDRHLLTPPVVANGTVYAVDWLWSTEWGFMQLFLSTIDAATGSGSETGIPYFYPNLDVTKSDFWGTMARVSPLLATVPGAQPTQSRQVLFVNAGTSVWRVDVEAGTAQSYHLPGGAARPQAVIGGFAYANGMLWFGDDVGSLYGLDDQFNPVPNTPAPLAPSDATASQILATPVPYTDSQGQSAILLSVWDQNASLPGLLAFDPTSGNTTTIPTQGTALLTVTQPTNGVIYAGGSAWASAAAGANAQVYAVRVDAALQGLRDFVVDSQLMQDFDDPSQPTHNDNGVARYQTHLTVVDNTKAPLVNAAVKIWADQSTNVIINDKNYTIGPDDDQYAAVKTSSNGALVIASGYTRADGSDKTDMSTATLRVWASFMDPYERLLVYPDREYHNRVATAHATVAGQAGADDPARANLQTAQKYGNLQQQGKGSANPLFTDQQKQDNQPQEVANAIQTMTGAVGGAPPAGSRSLKAAWSLRAVDNAARYVAYRDTPGAQYSPVNIAATRSVVVLQPTGFSYSQGSSSTPVFTSLTPAAATRAIDALDGQDWSTSQHAPAHVQAAARASTNAGRVHLGDFWSDFWDWIKGAVATITHIVVSIAEDIYTGIRVIVDGIAYVFNTIIAGIEQVANAIGAFFIELGHLIEEVIEALSVLFQFGHIIDTHNILKAELLKRINGDGSTSYPGLASIVTSQAVPQVDAFFKQGEQAINNGLNGLANALTGSTVTDLQGSGSTAHSAFSATPKSGGGTSSNATQSTWALHKFNGGIGASTTASALAATRRPLAADDPVSAFFNTFAGRLGGDGDLSSQWNQVKSGAQGMASSGSPGDFIKQGLAELVRIVALLLDGALAVSNALVDGLLGTITSLIQMMFDAQSGILTANLDIPVLSWLYQALFGEPLTILNALTLVISIPVTILWRVVEGQWPSDSLGVGTQSRVAALGEAPPILEQLMAYANAITTACLGFVYAAGDIMGEAGGPAILGRVALGGSLMVSVFSIPSLTSASPGRFDWASWGLSLGSGLLNILGSIDFSGGGGTVANIMGSFGLTVINLALVGVMGAQFGVDPPPDLVGKAVLGIDMAALLPGLINTWKLTGQILAAVVAVADVVMGFAGAVAILISALA